MTNIPAGYYPDPAGSPQQRWWNGTSWGDLQPASPSPAPTPAPAPAPYGSAQPYAPMQPYGSMQPYDASQPYYAAAGLRAPEGTNPTTTQAWIMAFWPLLGFLDLGITVALGGFSYESLTSTTTTISIATLASYGFTFLTWLGFAALAFADHRELKRRGIPQPFPWGWGFLGIVYIIGRSVVVRSRTGRGLTPLFIWIGAVVLNWIVGFVVGLALSASIVNSLYN